VRSILPCRGGAGAHTPKIGHLSLLANPHLAEGGVHHLAALDAQTIRIAEHRRAAQVVAVPEVQPGTVPTDNAERPTGPIIHRPLRFDIIDGGLPIAAMYRLALSL
jgi:hypothetical protein